VLRAAGSGYHGEEKASRARVPDPWEASGDAAVVATPASVPVLNGLRFRAACHQELRFLSMGSIRRLGFAHPSWFTLKAVFLHLEKFGSANYFRLYSLRFSKTSRFGHRHGL